MLAFSPCRRSSAIYIAPVPHALDGYHEHCIVHRVEHPVVTDANTVGILASLEFSAAGGAWFCGKWFDGAPDPALHAVIQFAHVLLRRAPKTNDVFRHGS